MPSGRPITVSLVHGTFASGSRWPGMEDGLARTLAGTDLEIHYPEWSGRNTVGARLDGAARLQAHVRSVGQRRPGALHVIVGHSHAGNVSLLALKDPEVRAAVSGVVCLSTPFLVCRPRTGPAQSGDLYGAAGMFGVLLPIVFILNWATGSPLLSSVAVSLLAVPLLWVGMRWQTRALTFLERVDLSALSGVSVLVVRSPADEASLFLTTLQAATRLLSTLWHFLAFHLPKLFASWLLRPRIRGRRVRALSAAVTVFVYWTLAGILYFVGAALLGRDVFDASAAEQVLIEPGIAIFLVFNGAFLLALLALVPIMGITAVLMCFFGPGYGLHLPFVEATVEASPPIPCQIESLPWTARDHPDGAFFHHTRSHDDPRAIMLVSEWILARVAASEGTGT